MMTMREKMATGEYTIEKRSNCNCSFDWDIRDGQLDDGCMSDECWEGNVLVIDGFDIAESIRYGESRVLADALKYDDIPDNIWDDMRMSNMVQQGESPNSDAHESSKRDSLIDYLSSLIDDGYRLMRDNQRGFANEYTCILVRPGTGDEDINDGWDELDAETWADEYLYNGDAATQAYNGFDII